jgi:hypothetical protein
MGFRDDSDLTQCALRVVQPLHALLDGFYIVTFFVELARYGKSVSGVCLLSFSILVCMCFCRSLD